MSNIKAEYVGMVKLTMSIEDACKLYQKLATSDTDGPLVDLELALDEVLTDDVPF